MSKCLGPLTLLCFGFLLGGCQWGKSFSTLAEYHAPKSSLRLVIRSRGHIEPGHDVSVLSGGTVEISWRASGKTKKVELTFPKGRGHKLYYFDPTGKARSARWGGPHSMKTLTHILSRAGATTSHINELKEVKAAINGAMVGPKGTLYRGQTKRLRVVRVEAGYNTLPSCR
ncbi:MAG: hypothetical protein EP343_33540 [Deltaproteobacteria bacterium]|nr:MAG: hypothetical protein EP343_33540 [Deltaproteobacteria bacterium]